jgi:hypothetical protein
MAEYPEEFLLLCRSVAAKRPKTVIDHILAHGHITTEELKDTYGYDHPPRAARDVREYGIPLETFRVVATNGRKIGAYRFGDPRKVRLQRFDGRTALSKELKDNLIAKYGCKCFIYLEEMDERALQIDHRVPYEVGGDEKGGTLNPSDFMLLCGSANRAKSWSCEHCENWTTKKDRKICLSCYWAYPEDFAHVAMRQIRRLDLVWEGDEVAAYERLKEDAAAYGATLPEFVKEIIRKQLGSD